MRKIFLGLALLASSCVATPQTSEVGTYVWTKPVENFGGFSGLEVMEGGREFVAITDRGFLTSGHFTRTDGAISGVTVGPLKALNAANGVRMPSWKADTEGLAIGPDGQISISFEARPRVWSYDNIDAPAIEHIKHPDFLKMQRNSALEALAIGPDGALYTLPERSGRANRPFQVYRFKDGAWDEPFTLPRRDAFLPVGADIGPDGLFYLLERDFTGIGFRSRVRRFDLNGGSETEILTTRVGQYDNLEGISIWQAPDGLRMVMISDDNFRFFQKTEFVEFRIPN